MPSVAYLRPVYLHSIYRDYFNSVYNSYYAVFLNRITYTPGKNTQLSLKPESNKASGLKASNITLLQAYVSNEPGMNLLLIFHAPATDQSCYREHAKGFGMITLVKKCIIPLVWRCINAE